MKKKIMWFLIFTIVFVIIVTLVLVFTILSFNNAKKPLSDSKFKIIDDDSVTGKINPFFCYGNPYSSSSKASSQTFWKNFASGKQYSVLGVGDNLGSGWQGGDSVGSIELTNGDLLFVFGDSFISKINNPNVWLSFRDETVQMPHNSVSYLKLGQGTILKNTFFVGQNRDNLINDLGLEFSTKCPFLAVPQQNYQKNPMDFTPSGCDSLLQPSYVKTTSKNVSCWLYGGMCNGNDLAILCGNYVGVKNLGFQFIEIKNALGSNALSLNPFLWDKQAIRHDLPSRPDILFEKMNKVNEKEYLIYGGKNLKPGAEVYLIKGSYSDFINKTFSIWTKDGWTVSLDLNKLEPLVVHDNRIVGPNYFSEFEYDGTNYFFFAISMDVLTNKYILIRYVSNTVTGPYEMDTSFTYTFPNWINSRSNELDCYDLRSHPGLAKCLKVRAVLSYVCQGRFPQYSGYFFDYTYSSYNVYYPQFILIDY